MNTKNRYFDIAKGATAEDIGLLFPGFDPQRESIAVLSPYDEDALLGAGTIMKAALDAGARVSLLIFIVESIAMSGIK